MDDAGVSDAAHQALKQLEALASRFAAEPTLSIALEWETQAAVARVDWSSAGIVVSLNSAQAEVSSVEQAETVLRGIFEDRIVALTGYADDQVSYCVLAPSDDLGAVLPTPSRLSPGSMPRTADLLVERWSGRED